MILTLEKSPTIVDLGWIQFAHGLLKPQERGRISSHVADKDQLAGSEACGLDIVRFSQGLSHRLFYKEMLAGFQTLHCVYALALYELIFRIRLAGNLLTWNSLNVELSISNRAYSTSFGKGNSLGMTDQYHIYVGARCQHFRPVEDVSTRGMPPI